MRVPGAGLAGPGTSLWTEVFVTGADPVWDSQRRMVGGPPSPRQYFGPFPGQIGDQMGRRHVRQVPAHVTGHRGEAPAGSRAGVNGAGLVPVVLDAASVTQRSTSTRGLASVAGGRSAIVSVVTVRLLPCGLAGCDTSSDSRRLPSDATCSATCTEESRKANPPGGRGI